MQAATSPAAVPSSSSSGVQPQRRVVVTGMGVVSPVGHEVDTFYNSLLEGKSGVELIESFDTGELDTGVG